MFLVLEEKVNVIIDGRTLDVYRDDIVSINPRQPHSFPQSETGTRLMFFQFETGVFSKNLWIADEVVFSRKPVLRGDGCPEQDASDEVLYAHACGLLADMFTEYRERKKGDRLAIKADFYRMALAYLRNGTPENGSLRMSLSAVQQEAAFVTDRHLEQVYQLIFKNFDHVSSCAANPDKAFEMLTYLLDEQFERPHRRELHPAAQRRCHNRPADKAGFRCNLGCAGRATLVRPVPDSRSVGCNVKCLPRTFRAVDHAVGICQTMGRRAKDRSQIGGH
ncbi:MAG: hypothetical protein LBG27_01660 [Spirochaetaceae bacterium]|nr:hypothetical protein [Spirochaetaceae bacterium]